MCGFWSGGCVRGSLRRELEEARGLLSRLLLPSGGDREVYPYVVRGGITLINAMSINANYTKFMRSWLRALVLQNLKGHPWLTGIPPNR